MCIRDRETRDQAIAYLEQRERELTNRLAQTEAELGAAMDGLRDSRSEAEDLRAYICLLYTSRCV